MRSLALFLLLTVAAATRAQVGEHRRDFAIGLTGGVTLNSVSFYPSVSQSMKLSPVYGLALRYICEKYFTAYCGINAEVNYCDLGWKEDFSESATPDYTYQRSMRYITVPIMARMGWGKETRGLQGFIQAGPQLGVLLSESEKMCDDLRGVNDGLSTARSSQYGKVAERTFDYGITAGAGMEVNTPRLGHFTLDARYYLGLSDIFNNGKADHFGRSANNTITVKLTYLFDILRTKK